MRIAILAISTNQYNSFVPNFVDSLSLLNGSDDKDIFLFSDRSYRGCVNYEVEHANWPFVTLKRFHTFKKAYRLLKEYDFILYLDIDMEVIVPCDIPLYNIDILGVEHPGNYVQDNFGPVEKNPISTACINDFSKKIYCQGCLWGAKRDSFFEMNETLINNIDKDFGNDYVAIWHDESHLNRYFYDNVDRLAILNSAYAYPENWTLPLSKNIIHKDKNMEQYPRFSGVK